MVWFVILLLVLGGGFYLYAKLKKIEREILAEQDAEKQARQQELRAQTAGVGNPEADEQTPQDETAGEVEGETDSPGLAEQLLRAVSEQPGIKQTALYPMFDAVPRRTIQYTLRELTDAGRLKREKIGNSFLLYP